MPSLRRQAGRAEPGSSCGRSSSTRRRTRSRVDGVPVALSAREYALLEALLARPGAILSRAQLEERLYGWKRGGRQQRRRRAPVTRCGASSRAEDDPQRARRRLDDAAARDAGVTRHHGAERRRELDPAHAAAVACRRPRARVRRGHRRHVPARPRRGERRCSTSSSRRWRRRSPACRWRHRRCRAASTRTARWSSRCGTATASRSIARRAGARLPAAGGPGFATVATATASGASTASSPAANSCRWRSRCRCARTRRQPGAADDRALARRHAVPRAAALVRASPARWRRSTASPPPSPRRNPRELAPLAATGWPREVEPLVEALNGLLGRLDAALGAQRTFIADAAHELRTPLTAVHLQAQLAARATGEAERGAALAAMSAGLARATQLAEQLLTLARADDAPRAPARRSTWRSSRATSSPSRRPSRRRATSTSASSPPLTTGGRQRRRCGTDHAAVQSRRQRGPLHARGWPRSTSSSRRATAGRCSPSATPVPAFPPPSASTCSSALPAAGRPAHPAAASASRSCAGSPMPTTRGSTLAAGPGGRGLAVTVTFAAPAREP